MLSFNVILLSSIFALSSLATEAFAIGRAIVTNQCDSPIYLWSAGGSVSNQTILPKDSTYGEKFRSDPTSGGIAIKITSTADGLTKPNTSQLIFAYNVDDTSVWYDLSSLFGDGFAGRTLRVQPSDEACDPISWHDGKTPAGSQVKKCQKETNLELTFCTGHCLPSWCK